MASVTRSELMAQAEALARSEACRIGGDGPSTDDLVEQAADVVQRLFHAIEFQSTDNAYSGREVSEWRHREALDVDNDWKSLSFDRETFRAAADEYLDHRWMQQKRMDWLIVNALTYAEMIATIDAFAVAQLSAWRYVTLRNGTRNQLVWMTLLGAIWACIKWLCWLALLALASAFASPWSTVAVVALLALTVGFLWKKHARQRARSKILDAMQRTYASVSSLSNSWRVIWDQLATSRAAGVVWDGSVYRLVEARLIAA